MDCVRTGYRVGLMQLHEGNPSFNFPQSCLQVAVAVGDYETLEFLLERGALASYSKVLSEIFYGGRRGPSQSMVLRCQRLLDTWCTKILMSEQPHNLQNACIAVLYKHGFASSPVMKLMPADPRQDIMNFRTQVKKDEEEASN